LRVILNNWDASSSSALTQIDVRRFCFWNGWRVVIDHTELRLDVIVEDILCVELKVIEKFLPIHDSILLTYMRMLQKPKGILINFNCVNIFKEDQKLW